MNRRSRGPHFQDVVTNAIVDGLGDLGCAIVVVDDDDRVLSSNAAVERVLGYTADEVIAMADPTALLAPAGRDEAMARRAAHKLGTDNTVFETEFTRKDGSICRVEMAVSRQVIDGEPFTFYVVHDIGERLAQQAARRGLLERVIRAGDEERRRIADGLHDDIIQSLAASALLVDSARQHADEGSIDHLAGVELTLRQAIDSLRQLIFELAPPELDELGLAATVTLVANHLFADSPTVVAVDVTVPQDIDPQAATISYRIAAEALTNARRHADASSVTVCLSYDDECVHGSVRDDGAGFSAEESEPGHLGLRTMRERAEMLGGSLTIDSDPTTRGTTVQWEIPAGRVSPSARSARHLYRDWRPPPVDVELHTPRAQFDALIEGSPDIITCFDRSLRHVYVNPAIETATGIPRASFIGRTNSELGMPADLADSWDASLHRAFVSGEPIDQLFTYPTPVGERTFHATLVPEREGGHVVHVWSIVRDVTALTGG